MSLLISALRRDSLAKLSVLTPNLRVLDISKNSITDIPPECFLEWKLMERLCASDNKLSSLKTILSMTSLKELDVSNNEITNIFAEIAMLKHLTNLDIQGNKIAELPAQLGAMQLKKLEVGLQRGNLR